METAITSAGRHVTIMNPRESLPNPVQVVCLAPREAQSPGAGKGSPEDPLRVAGPDEFDAAFRRPIQGPTTYYLARGRYATRGSWSFAHQGYAMLRDRCSLIGSGSEYTFVDLVDPILETDGKRRRDTNIMWAGPAYQHSIGIEVEGVTLSGQLGRQASDTVVGGLYIWGSLVRVFDVVVTGVRGDYRAQMEVFGIATINSGAEATPIVGGSSVCSCEIRDVAPGSYVSGISMGYRPRPGQKVVAHSEVQMCQVRLGSDNHFAFAACHQTRIEHCQSSGSRYGLYNDTDSVRDVVFERCDCAVSYAAIYFVADGAASEKEGVTVRRCRFDYRPVDGAEMIGLGILDRRGPKDAPPARDVLVVDSSFRLDAPNPFVVLATDATALGQVGFSRCRFPGGAMRVHAPKLKPWPMLSASVAGRDLAPVAAMEEWVG